MLGVTDSDFLVAGGLLAAHPVRKALLLDPDKPLPGPVKEFGIVPPGHAPARGPRAMAHHGRPAQQLRPHGQA